MQHVSIQLVATPVFYLIPVLPMLSARLSIILQSVLVLQATWEIHKLSANYHVRIIVRLKFNFSNDWIYKDLEQIIWELNQILGYLGVCSNRSVVNGFFVRVN